jgi:chromosome segregation ATPase
LAKIANFDNEIETLNDRITDLESQLQIERTAAQLSIDEAKAAARMGVDRAQHAAEAAVMAARTEAAAISAQAREQAAADVIAVQTKAQADLASAQAKAEAAVATAEAKLAALQNQLSDSQSVAMETARAGEPLRARVTTLEADLAKAKTALEKANTERHTLEDNAARLRDELASLRAQPQPRVDADDYAALLARAEEAESNVARLAGKADAADLAIGRASAVQRQLDEALSRLARLEHGRSTDSGLDATRNARLQALEADVASAEARSRELGSRVESISRELADTKAALADAERSHAAALDEAQDALAHANAVLATRETEMRELRQAAESRSKNFADPEATVSAPNLARYEAAVAELNVLRAELGTLRDELADAKRRAAAATPNVEAGLPAAALEQLSILEESIDSLRANLRAASDETAMMPSSESVTIIADAISQAAEHVERARDALRTITNL